MTEPHGIVERDALAIHGRLLVLDGGAPGLRDAGLLASALGRPLHHHEDAGTTDIIRLAALYTEAMVANHPFADGHERVGFVVGVLFLELHGTTFSAPQELATHMVLDLAAGRTGIDGYERFLRDHVVLLDVNG